MEIHPDDLDDPEENEWVLPSLPDPTSVPDNTKSWSIFYVWSGQPNPWQHRVTVALTREITVPWRRGLGIMIRVRGTAYAVGVWTRGRAPRILTDAPSEKNLGDVVTRSENLERGLEHN